MGNGSLVEQVWLDLKWSWGWIWNSGVGVGIGVEISGVGIGVGVETSGVGVGVGVDILDICRSWNWSWSWNLRSWSWSWSWYSGHWPELELELKPPELELELELILWSWPQPCWQTLMGLKLIHVNKRGAREPAMQWFHLPGPSQCWEIMEDSNIYWCLLFLKYIQHKVDTSTRNMWQCRIYANTLIWNINHVSKLYFNTSSPK